MRLPCVTTKVPVKTISIETTKVMPTEFPKDFAFRPMQEEKEGVHRAYMVPGAYKSAIDAAVYKYSATPAALGFKDLSNVFYGIKDDQNYEFKFATTAIDEDGEYTKVKPVTFGTVYDNSQDGDPVVASYILQVDNALIDQTSHDVKVDYLYRGVSTTYDAEKKIWNIGKDYPVAYGKQITFIYDCWANASKFSWKAPSLQWSTEGTPNDPYAISNITTTNSYDNTFFGKNLDVLINNVNYQWLKIKDDKVVLKSGDQINPYFSVVVSNVNVPAKPAEYNYRPKVDSEGNPVLDVNGKQVMEKYEVSPYVPAHTIKGFVFNQQSTQIDAAPTANHTETLEFTLIDVYGHEKLVELNVNVKAPEKK